MEASVKEEGIIRVMPEMLANRIAAGEVVQRPASVAKELIENALDAGASAIEIVVRDAGRTLVQVVDDGCGMSASDAGRAFERHATSKIRSVEDLGRILTLGFRGEALASIASVSRVEMRTRRREDSIGTAVRLEGGEGPLAEPCATPAGTNVAVRHLFYNVPARRSFLKSDATEMRHLLDTAQNAALANPGVSFRLSHDGTVVLESPAEDGPGALVRRIRDLFGHREDVLVEVREETSYLRVSGFVARPSVRRRSRGDQYLFVNGRPVRSPYLDHAVFSAFRGLLPDGSYPFFALFLGIDPRHVDVNVHPAKSEVKFDDERGVHAMLRAVVGRALGQAEGIPRLEEAPDLLGGIARDSRDKMRGAGTGTGAGRERGWDGPLTDPSRRGAPFGADGPLTDPERRGAPFGADGRLTDPERPGVPSGAHEPGVLSKWLYGPGPEGVAEPRPPTRPDESARPELLASEAMEARPETDVDGRLWQIRETYVVAPIRTGLMIVDQHAAHERIVFERALAGLDEGFAPSQQLLFPRTVDLTPADRVLLAEILTDLKSIGFDVEPLSGRSVMIRGVPSGIRTGEEELLLEGVIGQYREFERTQRLRGRTNLARSLAKRSAIRAGTRLDPLEMRALIDQLFECSQPYTAPDGRPTLVRIGSDELDRRFGRRQ